jgi:hypothetical protein
MSAEGDELNLDCFEFPEKKLKRYGRPFDVSFLINGSYIYFLYLDGDLQYIGQSRYVPSRLAWHKKYFKFNRVRLLQVKSHDMNDVERALIKKHQPPRAAENRARIKAERAPPKHDDDLIGWRTQLAFEKKVNAILEGNSCANQ